MRCAHENAVLTPCIAPNAAVDVVANVTVAPCDAQTERTPLHIAAANQQPEVIAVLLAANAPHDAKDTSGNVPLHLAVQVSCCHLFKMHQNVDFLKRGTSILPLVVSGVHETFSCATAWWLPARIPQCSRTLCHQCTTSILRIHFM